MQKIVIPATLPGLNEYVRACRTHAQRGSRINRDAHYICRLGMVPFHGKRLQSVVPVFRWYEASKRRDKDNIAFAKKFILDSLQEMDILKNDGWEQVPGFLDEFYVDKVNPRVEVLLFEPQDKALFFRELRHWTIRIWGEYKRRDHDEL